MACDITTAPLNDQNISSVTADKAAAGPLRVLVVDDNRDAADSLKMLIERLDCDVQTAYGGAEALRMADDFRPDVIVLDIGLPDVNGFSLARQLRQNSAHQKAVLIAVSGYQHQEKACEEAGINLYFLKPMDPSMLADLLRVAAEMAGR